MATVVVASFSGVDYSKEPFSIQVNLKPVVDADGNFDPTAIPTLWDMVDNPASLLRLAIENIMIADVTDVTVSIMHSEARAIPADKNAQRERRAKVKYLDTQWNKRFEFTIPCVDLGAIVLEHTDKVNMALPQIVALKAAIETYCCSPYQNNIVVDDIELIGRPG